MNKQNKLAESERAYESASKLKDNDPQAWQGLIQLYEQQGGDKVDAYQLAAFKLAQIYETADDKYKCQDVIDRFLGFAKREGTRLQQKEAQKLVLPTSPLYDYLEGRVPHPAHTYQLMAQITEIDEKERINREIGERRTRLGAKIGQVTIEVKREVFRSSDLEYLYRMVIDWTNDDDLRRQYEEKLLQRCFDALSFLPAGQEKDVKRAEVFKLATDMVIIKHPLRLAWDIAIEWQDIKSVTDLDVNVLREYCSFFPTAGLSHVLRGYLSSEISLFTAPPPPVVRDGVDTETDESEDDDDGGGGVNLDGPLDAEDRLLVMTDGMADAHKSILAHRLMAEYYQFLEEYESVVPLMRSGRHLVQAESALTALPFDNSLEAITAFLGTALVFWQSPKNHPEAREVFESILAKNPTSTPALIGYGYIYEEDEDYPAAIEFLERALIKDSENLRVKAEAAWVRALNGDYIAGKAGLEACLAQVDSKDVRAKELSAQVQYRIGICLWNIDTSKPARKDRQGPYAYFLAALKNNLNYAPAYTSLGIYYADYSKDKKRARKCFQKAFELSASEVESAERLARIFAELGEWDLVEVVAQRVVDSGKVRPAPGSKKKGASWPYSALGVAELNKLDYSKSIVSFQSALRITPNDYHSWVGLGESYHNSGRYIAATRAFQHAETFEHEVEQQESGETWFAKYMLANVKRELGEHDEAINGYKSVLETKSEERGVAIALIQASAESAWQSIERGLFGHAIARANETIEVAAKLVDAGNDSFNIWRAVGDACAIYSWVQEKTSSFPHQKLKQLLQSGDAQGSTNLFSDTDGVGADVVFANGLYPTDEEDGVNPTRSLHGSIIAHKRAVTACATDLHAQAVAYYNLGWAEYRAHVCLYESLKRTSTRYLKAAVRCFKRAIELEAGNFEFWNALGVVTSELNPKVAQHSFVRSLHLNERSAQTWTNLGVLYLLQNDYQLANEAFTRAQSNDPEYAHAWIGQGLLALLMSGDKREAKLLFTHAMEIDETSSLITKQQYAQATYDQILEENAISDVTDLVQPLFSLIQLRSMSTSDLPHSHLLSLFQERVTDTSEAISTLSKICSVVEADYEVTESPSSLSRFALAKADYARLLLAAGLYVEAIDSGETALQLSAEDAGSELSAECRQKCRLSAHLTTGLAHYHLQQPDEAINYFTPALEESNNNPDTVCLLAQVLWAQGSSSSKSQAREQLFDTVEKHPNHVQSIILLGIITLIDNDTESVEAVLESLHDLRTAHTTTPAEQSSIGELLRAFAIVASEGHSDEAVLTEVQTDIFLHPGHPSGWSRLAQTAGIKGDDEFANEMALKTALKVEKSNGILSAADVGDAYAGTGKHRDAQVSVMMSPWTKAGWEVLAA